MITEIPTCPLVGLKLNIDGVTRNLRLLLRVVPEVTTFTNPVVAPAGTVAVKNVSDVTVNVAEVPLKVTLLVPFKPWPRMPIVLPVLPDQLTSPAKGFNPTSRL